MFDKWPGGDELHDEEQADVEEFKDERRSKQHHRQEFHQDLLDNGEDVNEDRLHCLELFTRQHLLGEKLTQRTNCWMTRILK
mgnify:CR=1 FL=1|jgi:hypothetical protein